MVYPTRNPKLLRIFSIKLEGINPVLTDEIDKKLIANLKAIPLTGIDFILDL